MGEISANDDGSILREIRQDLRNLSSEFIVLKTTSELYMKTNAEEKHAINDIAIKVNKAEGGLLILKLIGGAVTSALMLIAGWLLTNYTSMQQKVNDLNTQISIIQSKQVRLDTDINSMDQRISQPLRQSGEKHELDR